MSDRVALLDRGGQSVDRLDVDVTAFTLHSYSSKPMVLRESASIWVYDSRHLPRPGADLIAGPQHQWVRSPAPVLSGQQMDSL